MTHNKIKMSTGKIDILDKEYKGPCVYMILNEKSGKLYIGSAKNYRKRAMEHKNHLIKNKHGNIHLQRTFNKGATLIINVMHYCREEERIDKEKFWIETCNTMDRNKGYNICEPLSLNWNRKRSQKEIDRIIEAGKNTRFTHGQTRDQIEKSNLKRYKKVHILDLKDNYLTTADSMIEAEELTGTKRQNVSAVCRGLILQCNGYKFKYAQ